MSSGSGAYDTGCLVMKSLKKRKKKQLRPFFCFTVPPRSTNNVIPLSVTTFTVEERSVLLLVSITNSLRNLLYSAREGKKKSDTLIVLSGPREASQMQCQLLSTIIGLRLCNLNLYYVKLWAWRFGWSCGSLYKNLDCNFWRHTLPLTNVTVQKVQFISNKMHYLSSQYTLGFVSAVLLGLVWPLAYGG